MSHQDARLNRGNAATSDSVPRSLGAAPVSRPHGPLEAQNSGYTNACRPWRLLLMAMPAVRIPLRRAVKGTPLPQSRRHLNAGSADERRRCRLLARACRPRCAAFAYCI